MRRAARASLIGFWCMAACSTAAEGPHAQAPSDIVATVGAASVTLADVDERALQRPAADFGSLRLSQAMYESRMSVLDAIVGNLLLDIEAKARGIDQETLTQQEITSKVTAPTDAEVVAWYQGNPARVQGMGVDQARGPIRQLLTEERTLAARARFLDILKTKTAVKVSLDPPRERVAAAGRPSRGPASAKVEIIEFSDFQCPYCLRVHPVVAQVLKTYGDRIRFVYRHYPLPGHPNARPAAEAAACAAEQGKFWQYHDWLFDHQDKLSDADLKQDAISLGLDSAKFNTCVSSRQYQKDVEADIAAGNDVGITGTPAFFINGRVLDGAQPFEAFTRVIDEELRR